MELSVYHKKIRMKAVVDWTPRTENKETNRLANGDFKGCDPARRVHLIPSNIHWDTLPQELRLGREVDSEEPFAKEQGTISKRAVQRMKRKLEARLKMTDA